jgi:Mg-chelatase subunit ChlD
MPRRYEPPGGHHDRSGNPLFDADEALRQVDICFVMDATGSMSSYIDATRKELKAFASKLATHSMKPKMAYGLVLYRDHPPEDSSFVTNLSPLSENLEQTQQALNRASAEGGGDGPEAVVDGIYDAVYRMQWRKGSHKVILLAGDAPPHGEGASGDGFSRGCPCGHNVQTVAQEAREKGITIFCLGIGNDRDMQRTFQQIAKNSGGQYVPLASAGTLINNVLTITMGEFGKVDIDRVVMAAYSSSATPASIARATGLNITDVTASIDRLKRKELI